MKTGIVKKAFPYSEDGFTIKQAAVDDVLSFPDSIFDGLEKTGVIEASKKTPSNLSVARGDFYTAENHMIIDALDKRLAGSSDEELLTIIARSGTPYSGNLVHAEMVAAAKAQIAAEMAGTDPVFGIAPYAGRTEMPIQKPSGEPTENKRAETGDDQTSQRMGETGKVSTGGAEDDEKIPTDWRDRHHAQQIAMAKRIDPSVSNKAEAVAVLEKATA